MVWSEKVDDLLKIGQSLDDNGVSNWALTKTQALSLLEAFSSLGIPILGGDVYENVQGTLRVNYDNWYCDPEPDETNIDFTKRSIAKAKDYMEAYSTADPDRILFALVPNV